MYQCLKKAEWCVYYTKRDKPERLFYSREKSEADQFAADEFERWEGIKNHFTSSP
jgi:hypothetical protein